LTFEILASFVRGMDSVAMMLAMLGGLLSMAWYVLLARRLLQFGRRAPTAPGEGLK